jgi:hypothetical protein
LVKHFNDLNICKVLEEKRIVFLNFALDAYTNANTCNNYADEEEQTITDTANTKKENEQTEESNSLSVEQQSQQVSAVTTQKSSKSQQVNNDSDSGEEWLHHYMLGKIKEKLNQSSIMESLNHYLKVFQIILKKTVILNQSFIIF